MITYSKCIKQYIYEIETFRIGNNQGRHAGTEQCASHRHGKISVHCQKQRAADGQQGIQRTNTL